MPTTTSTTSTTSITATPPQSNAPVHPPSLAHILVIEHDAITAQVLELELGYEGYRVSVSQDGMTGLVAVRTINPDLIILSWSLPGMSALEICQRLRSTGSHIPIIVLTEEGQVGDRIASLSAGADDSISRPFSLAELVARIRIHLRQLHEQKSDLLHFSDLILNRKTRNVFRNNQPVELTAKEFDLLDYLMTHARQVVTRDQFLQNVWGYDFEGTSNVVDVYIGYLRNKLEIPNPKRLIHTLRSVGYILRD